MPGFFIIMISGVLLPISGNSGTKAYGWSGFSRLQEPNYRNIHCLSNTLHKQSRENFIVRTTDAFISILFLREESF